MTYCECCGETTAHIRRPNRRTKHTREDAYVALPRDEDFHMCGYELNAAEKALENAVREALLDIDHPYGVAMNKALVTLTVFKFVPHPRVGHSFKVDCTVDSTTGALVFQNFTRRNFLKLASDYGRLDFGQTSVIIRTFYATKKGDQGMPYKRVRGFVMWSKGRRRSDGSRDVAFGRASKADLIASYAMDPPPAAERVEFVGADY
jgi:small-conductance mechanosensitive channel